MSRPLRIAGYIGIGIAAGLLVAALAIFVLTRTNWGMERARRFAVEWLADRINGTLHIGSVGGRGLLSGVIIRDFGITGENGRPFVRADSLELAYNWRTLLAGQIVANRVVLHGPELQLEQLPGDTIWNYEHIFADTTTATGQPRARSLIRFRDAHVRNGRGIIRVPFEPDGPVAVEDTARINLEPVPGGLARVIRFEEVNARLDDVIWESPIEPGQLFNIASVSGRGFVQREPFTVRDAHGTLTARDTVIAFDFQDVTLPGSRANVLGTVVQREGKNIFDIRVDADRFQFTDLQWLYPRLPQEGGGSVVLRIQTQPRGILFFAEDARIQAPGTQLAGTVGIVAGDTLYFTRVNLRASPLDVKLLEQLLPGGLPVEGLLIGTVEVRGPLSALETSGDMRLAGGGVGDGSQITWSGVLDVQDRDIAARSLRADVTNLELALLNSLSPKLRLDGRVSGAVSGSGGLDQLAFQASLTRSGRAGEQASFQGSGALRREGDVHALEITADATSATFEDLAHYVPALAGFKGELHGPVRLQGTSRDLHFDARLATDGGPVQLDGRVVNRAGGPHVTARARGESFRLHALRPGSAELLLTGTMDVDITGASLADAAGTARIVLDSARAGALPIGRVSIGGRLADGVFTVDSASLDTRAGLGRATGTVALVDGRQGELQIGFISESLTPLESYLMGDAPAQQDEPRLDGRIDASGTLSGWIGNLDVTASARAADLLYGGSKAWRLNAELEMRGLRSGAPAPVRLAVTGDSVTLSSHPLHAVTAEATGILDSLHVAINARAADAEVVHVRGDIVHPAVGVTAMRVGEVRLGSRSPWTLSAPGSVVLQDGVVRVDALELARAAGGRARIDGQLGWAASPDAAAPPLDFNVSLDGVPFADMLTLLRSNEDGAGLLDGTLRFTGNALDPVVEGELNGRDLRYGDVRIDHAFAELNYTALGLDAHAEAQYDGRSILTGGGRIPVDLRFTPVAERRLDEPLRFTISADQLPPALPLSLISGFTGARGSIDGTLVLAGTTLDPALSGGFTIRDGGVDWDVTGVRYRDVNGTLALERDRILRVDVDARAIDPRERSPLADRAGNGSGTITGTLDFAKLTNPRFDLRLGADRVFAARRRDVEATVSGELRLGGQYTDPEVSGAIVVQEGALYLDEIYRQYLIVSLDDLTAVDTTLVSTTSVLGNMIANAQNPFLRGIVIRGLDVRVGADTWLRSQDMDVEVTGNLTVAFNRREEDLRLTGTLNVERGTYTLYYPPLQSRRFNVRQGTVDFPGIPGIDPNLSITAAYKARDTYGEPLDILAVVSGSLKNPRVHLTSEGQTGIGESDLASYLFFGVPTSDVNTGTRELRAVAGLGFSALKPSVLGYASSGLQTLVQSAGLLDYAAFTTAAEAVPGSRTNSAVASFLAETQLEIGRYLGSNFFLGISQRLGSYDPAARLEWRFLPEFTLELFGEDRFARTPGFGLRQESEKLKRVYGFSLFREWGF